MSEADSNIIIVDLEAVQRRSDTALRIERTFQRHGPLTIAQVMHLTGIHTESIRHFVKPPHYQAISHDKTKQQWEVTWALAPNAADEVRNCVPMRRLTGMQQHVLEGIRNGHDTANKLASLLYGENTEETRKLIYKLILDMRKRGLPISPEKDPNDMRYIRYRVGEIYGESTL